MKDILPFSCDNRTRTCDLHLKAVTSYPCPISLRLHVFLLYRILLTPILLLTGFHNIFVSHSSGGENWTLALFLHLSSQLMRLVRHTNSLHLRNVFYFKIKMLLSNSQWCVGHNATKLFILFTSLIIEAESSNELTGFLWHTS